MKNNKIAKLLICCRDRKGIVAKVSNFLFKNGANIIQSDQYTTDYQNGHFFMRIEFDQTNLSISKQIFEKKFSLIAENLEIKWSLYEGKKKKRMAIFVSKEGHCLFDLLWRWKSGELDVDIPVIISNHNDLKLLAEDFNITYHHFNISKENKEDQEKEILKHLYNIDFIVLARYMQILSAKFINHYPSKIINIHHSFLPAFAGAKPYEKAYQRGVKLIGATAHYATTNLDEGPIIEQDVLRVTHKDNPSDLKHKGQDIEKAVLAKAVKWHLEDRIIVHNNKTIVFS